MEAVAVRSPYGVDLSFDESEVDGVELQPDELPEGAKGGNSKLSREQVDAIIVDNRELGRRLAWSLLSSWRMKLSSDDVTSAVGTALCEAANRFDPDKGVAFKTFFFYHLRGTLLKEVSRIIQEQKVCRYVPGTLLAAGTSGEQVLPAAWLSALSDTEDPEKITQRKQLIEMCKKACSYLDPLEQEVVIRSVAYEEALIDIADNLGYCRCHISRVKSRAMAKLSKVVGELMGKDAPRKAPAVAAPEVGEANARSLRGNARAGYTGGRGRRKSHKPVQQSQSFKRLVGGAA